MTCGLTDPLLAFALFGSIWAQGTPECQYSSTVFQLSIGGSYVDLDHYSKQAVPQTKWGYSYLSVDAKKQPAHEVMLLSDNILFSNGPGAPPADYAFEINWNYNQEPKKTKGQTTTYAALSGQGACFIKFSGVKSGQIKSINTYRLKKLN